MSAIAQLGPVESASPAKAWLRALELTAPIAKNPGRALPTVVEVRWPSSPTGNS
jgi:hypothetical protein